MCEVLVETLEFEKRNKLLEFVYIIILAASAMGDMPSFSADMSRAMKGISVLIVIVGIAYLFLKGKTDRIRTAGRFVGLYGFILIGIIVWSIFLWIVNLESIDFIMRGTTKFMFQFLVLMIIFAGVYLFGERAIYTTFYGIVLANIIMMLINLAIYGPVNAYETTIAMFQGAESQTGFARAMEIHDITFSYGFYVIYFLFFAHHNKERNVAIILSVFFFLLGWKRIALVALPTALFLGLILGRIKSNTRVTLMKFLAWLIVLLSFTYVVLTRMGWFEMITEYFGIDSMGRNEVYAYIEKYYDINIGFLGYGFEYTTVILQQVMNTNPEAHIGVVALHNNILTVYIELGFIGFWAWMIYTWVFQLRWMLRHWGEKVAMLFFLCELYIFLTYTTDNTLYYYYTSLSLRLMPLAYVFHKPTSREIRFWPWVREKRLI